MVQCGARLAHVHLHDFVKTDHYPPFDGYIEWGEIFLALQQIGYAGAFVFEAVCPISIEDTLHKTAAFPQEFARRYGG
jgi:sugar phosphate isomerase/epimerase